MHKTESGILVPEREIIRPFFGPYICSRRRRSPVRSPRYQHGNFPMMNSLTGFFKRRPAAGGGGGGAYTVDAADFDGTNDWLSRGAGLTGAADGKSGILSYWFYPEANQSVLMTHVIGTASKFSCTNNTDRTISISATRAADATAIMAGNTTSLFTANAWNHVAFSWDLAATVAHMYLNGASAGTFAILTNDTIPYATGTTNWTVHANRLGNAKLNGGAAEVYLALNQYLDLSVSSNLEKFRSAAGKPVNLGSNGSTPTGSQPTIYLSLADGAAASTYASNLGSGGAFTVNGSLTTFPSSPTD